MTRETAEDRLEAIVERLRATVPLAQTRNRHWPALWTAAVDDLHDLIRDLTPADD